MARRKDKAAAAHAGEQAARAMAMSTQDKLVRRGCSAVLRGEEPEDDWWYYEQQAVRMARIACYHAFKAIPKLKPLDSYETALLQHRETARGLR